MNYSNGGFMSNNKEIYEYLRNFYVKVPKRAVNLDAHTDYHKLIVHEIPDYIFNSIIKPQLDKNKLKKEYRCFGSVMTKYGIRRLVPYFGFIDTDYKSESEGLSIIFTCPIHQEGEYVYLSLNQGVGGEDVIPTNTLLKNAKRYYNSVEDDILARDFFKGPLEYINNQTGFDSSTAGGTICWTKYNCSKELINDMDDEKLDILYDELDKKISLDVISMLEIYEKIPAGLI